MPAWRGQVHAHDSYLLCGNGVLGPTFLAPPFLLWETTVGRRTDFNICHEYFVHVCTRADTKGHMNVTPARVPSSQSSAKAAQHRDNPNGASKDVHTTVAPCLRTFLARPLRAIIGPQAELRLPFVRVLPSGCTSVLCPRKGEAAGITKAVDAQMLLATAALPINAVEYIMVA